MSNIHNTNIPNDLPNEQPNNLTIPQTAPPNYHWTDKMKIYILKRKDKLLSREMSKSKLTKKLNKKFGTEKTQRAVERMVDKLGCTNKRGTKI